MVTTVNLPPAGPATDLPLAILGQPKLPSSIIRLVAPEVAAWTILTETTFDHAFSSINWLVAPKVVVPTVLSPLATERPLTKPAHTVSSLNGLVMTALLPLAVPAAKKRIKILSTLGETQHANVKVYRSIQTDIEKEAGFSFTLNNRD